MNKYLPGIAGLYIGLVSLFYIALISCATIPAEKKETSVTKSSTSKTTTKTTTKAPSEEKREVVTPSKPVVAANGAPGLERDILNLVNEYRQSRKLAPLTNNAAMEYQARMHSMNMATLRIPFGHQGMSFRMKYVKEKVSGVTDVAENVAYGNLSAKAVVQGWLKSPAHKKNIEGNYKYSGVGVARNAQNQLYFTQIFAK
jgi:Uncharacterized protein with SCP/PR1 domains